ncbi:hypothetical protein F9L16_23510 [Agarivorans sp. B2Z047]|uniref:DUF5675 family protein n=1 Tax=Agarivorans sp. B2Z047 TaxID=2652721 RepID=UPI00128B5E58|nr:DUF5675 family protein [Agarivorans sp. B2Z047]MPW31925.1 hypothetical protein [Agarivorans sp. B2Z047]UQN41895.1 DUF5675 family protein [Agarivorans sp. B2Z047]
MSKTLHLKTKNIPGIGCFGEMFFAGKRICVTVEREWMNNEPFISCIPPGKYHIKHHQSPKFKHCLSIEAKSLGVTLEGPSQRTHCLIHAANFPMQLHGCIAPGKEFHRDTWGVLRSRDALKELLALLPERQVHTLIIERH